MFVPIVFFFYWYIFGNNLKLQNIILLVASYVFYGWWDYRFLTLIIFSSVVDYSVGLGLEFYKKVYIRRSLLMISLLVNLGMLAVFKYYNFFILSFATAANTVGWEINPDRLNIILPVGISFYTFQTLSYSIDVYRKKINHSNDPIAFFAFVGFFPQLVAGPIERASNLLPQFLKSRRFNYSKSVDGLRQILWGLFKKVVIADNCAIVVNNIFDNYSGYSGMVLLLGAIFFSFQIYADFSGYSDIAIGTARLFGFNIMRNFSFPYFSRDIAEFWRCWHISLSTWFRDYVYIPIGGSHGSIFVQIRNILIIFVVSGMWHGANWTFVLWGLLNALYFIPLLLRKKNRLNTEVVAKGKYLPSIKEAIQIMITFVMVSLAWVFFRADNLKHAFNYLYRLFSYQTFFFTEIDLKMLRRMTAGTDIIYILLFIIFMLVFEWWQREKQHALEFYGTSLNIVSRWGLFYSIAFFILWFGGTQQDFIYFQF